MQLGALSGSAGAFSHTFERWFPTPRTLRPASLGVDISDSSVKWLGLMPLNDGRFFKVRTFGSAKLESGIVSGGLVRDVPKLGEALASIKDKFGGVERAHAALPEELAYVFSMSVPEGIGRDEVMRLIEFEFEGRVPIPPTAAIYDFDVVAEKGKEGMEIGVVVFPRDVAESYAAAFDAAGIELLSLEIEARSIARAIWSENDPITLLVDFGLARTGFALLKRGIPIFTSTVDVGGDAVTQVVMEKLKLPPEEATLFKNEQGLTASGPDMKATVEAMAATASALSDEIAKHFHYWDTRRDAHGDRVTPVGRVLLVGGSANLAGLPAFIAGKVQAPVERGNIWGNICAFENYIPPIDFRTSMQFATAVGLGLRGI
jgi:type IV pilus assembly protein PilM